jgi:chromosome partitioning protein
VRKLLVASQKGGVGKTTTSINLAAAAAMAGVRVLLLDADPLSSISTSLNLAEHPRRQSLREAGIALPGVLVCDVIPGLDVLSPYEDGGCSDDDLDQLFALLASRAFQEGYGCLLVDTPPFMGASPGQLLATCDEFVIVMRAEPMAYRTLPAFLELVQRQKTPAGNRAIKMRGILVTLPEGEQSGGRWERELRGRFGTRILPDIVPYDDVVNQSRLFGQIVGHEHRQSPVAEAYHALAESLELASASRDSTARPSAASTLLLAWASLKPSPPAVRPAPIPAKAPSPAPLFAAAPGGLRTPPTKAPPPPVEPVEPLDQEEVDLAEDMAPDLDELDAHILDQAASVAPLPPIAPSAALEPLAPLPAPPPVRPSSFRSNPRPVEPRAPAPAPVKVARAPAPTSRGFPIGVRFLLVGVALTIGLGLRFLDLPDAMIPIIVGLAVAVVVILGMVYLMPQQDEEPEHVAAPVPAPRPAGKLSNRLSGYTRRASAKSGRSVNDN